ncbi:MAG TPA: acyl carrier protein [Gemmatimonadota bacterium]|nr:acyl carrier protein [Gemmatimonadota bacterium]
MSQQPVSQQEIRNAVREYLLTEFLPGEDASALTDSTPLITGGILDSIASVKLVSHLEDRFGIRFEAREVSVDYLDTVDRIVETVENKRHA